MWQEENLSKAWHDPIVEGIRKVRREHAARFNYDLDAIAADFKSREKEGAYKLVTLPPRRGRALESRSTD